MREFQPEIDRISADAADRLRGIDALLVGVELCPLRPVVIGTQVRLCSGCVRHGHAPFKSYSQHCSGRSTSSYTIHRLDNRKVNAAVLDSVPVDVAVVLGNVNTVHFGLPPYPIYPRTHFVVGRVDAISYYRFDFSALSVNWR